MRLPGVVLLLATGVAAAIASLGCHQDPGPVSGEGGRVVLRVGHFSNVTHAQGLVAHALTRQGKGWFEERLGRSVEIEWFVYNAGPSAMEALLAGSIDLTYAGPSPALNAHLRSKGAEIRVIAGAAEGGAALVVRPDANLAEPTDFRGKRVATPQLGNTQDVACRAWLKEHGFQVTQTGGDVQVVPMANPEQVTLFKSGDVAAVWTVEPWVTRLELEAGGKVLLEEADAVTTVLVASSRFLLDRPEIARAFVDAHAELTDWIQDHPEDAQRLVNEELKVELTRSLPEEVLARAWTRIRFTSEISRKPLEDFVRAAKSVGFLPGEVDVSRLIEVPR